MADTTPARRNSSTPARNASTPAAKREARPALYSTVFNASTYGLALYAYASAPVAPMAALRELSIVFGAVLAALVLKEPFGLRRTMLAICLAAGLVLLQVM